MNKVKNIIFLNLILIIYAISSVCSKFASGYPFLSPEWIILYGLLIFFLGIYALLWQQILKRLPLNLAYANKSVTLIWGMIFGAVIFDEKITVTNVIGAVIVLAGVIIMSTSSPKTETKPDTAETQKGGDNNG